MLQFMTKDIIKIEPDEIINLDDPDKFFHFEDGTKIVSLQDFIDKLPTMSDEFFQKHTREFDNDFAKWISGVFEDETLAKKIRGVTNKMELQGILISDRRGEVWDYLGKKAPQ